MFLVDGEWWKRNTFGGFLKRRKTYFAMDIFIVSIGCFHFKRIFWSIFHENVWWNTWSKSTVAIIRFFLFNFQITLWGLFSFAIGLPCRDLFCVSHLLGFNLYFNSYFPMGNLGTHFRKRRNFSENTSHRQDLSNKVSLDFYPKPMSKYSITMSFTVMFSHWSKILV